MYCNTSYPPHGVLKRSRGCQSESRATPAGPSPTANQLDTGEPLGQDEFRLTTIHTLIHHRSGEMTILGRLAAAGGGTVAPGSPHLFRRAVERSPDFLSNLVV